MNGFVLLNHRTITYFILACITKHSKILFLSFRGGELDVFGKNFSILVHLFFVINKREIRDDNQNWHMQQKHFYISCITIAHPHNATRSASTTIMSVWSALKVVNDVLSLLYRMHRSSNYKMRKLFLKFSEAGLGILFLYWFPVRIRSHTREYFSLVCRDSRNYIKHCIVWIHSIISNFHFIGRSWSSVRNIII